MDQLRSMESVARGDFTDHVEKHDLTYEEAYSSLEMYDSAHADNAVQYHYGYLMGIRAVIRVLKKG